MDPPVGGGAIIGAVTLLTIGDFSRMSYLSVKTLRHYHETGLLEPAEVDGDTGYRRYDAAQVRTAQVIRRFRDLGMPIDQVKLVLDATDLETRNRIVAEHLARMESELEETRRTVSSLRNLLETPRGSVGVEFRSVPAVEAIEISEPVRMAEAEQWWEDAFRALYDALDAAGIEPAGPGGAFYSGAFFEQEHGEVTAFVPIGSAAGAGPRRVEIPGGEFAVAVHEGSFAELDRTYAALGTFVADRAIGVPGPIREHYLVSAFDTENEAAHRTEVCWPVLPTRRTSCDA
jgi:DNA-binding transcriptional MerR regulator